MSSEITIRNLVETTAELQQLFSKIESRPWTIDACAIELAAEVGTLADSIMIKEGYRELRHGQEPINIEDDICDIIFVLIMIAEHYKINIGDSYISMADSTRKKLEIKIENLSVSRQRE